MPASQPTLKTLASSALSGVALVHEGYVDFGNQCIRLQTNSLPLLHRLVDYFRVYRTQPAANAIDVKLVVAAPPDWVLPWRDWPRDAGKSGRKEEYCDLVDGRVVRKVRTGMQFLVGPNIRLAVGNGEEHDNQVINFVLAHCVESLLQRGAGLCHAAAVARNGRGLLISASAGSGKSTLALLLMNAGYTFVSNDRVLVAPGNAGQAATLHGIAKQPRVNPGTLLHNPRLVDVLAQSRAAELRELSAEALWQVQEKYDVDLQRRYGKDRWQLHCPLEAVLVLNWSRVSTERHARFQRIDLSARRDLLALLIKAPGPFSLSGGASSDGCPPWQADDYLRALSQVPVYEASAAVEFAAAARLCDRLTSAPKVKAGV